MALSNIDRELLERCLARSPRAWEDFVDRFVGLVYHVVSHSAQCRNVEISKELREDLCAEVFLCLVQSNFGVLRRFRGQSSLATYLTVVARRVVVRKLVQLKLNQPPTQTIEHAAAIPAPHYPVLQTESAQEVELALHRLSGQEATAVRMFHLEGKTYSDISSSIGMPENSVGPLLTRAREKMRQILD